MIHFIDFEASSLDKDSFPIEVAWVDGNGAPEQYLIRPHQDWLDNGCPGWSPASEAVHGISMQTLLAEGVPASVVAARVAKVFSKPGERVFSDAPDFDGAWLGKLLATGAADVRIEVGDVVEAYGAACRPLLGLLPPEGTADRTKGLADIRWQAGDIVSKAQMEEELRPRKVRHRALPDAESLWRTWRSVQTRVSEHMQATADATAGKGSVLSEVGGGIGGAETGNIRGVRLP